MRQSQKFKILRGESQEADTLDLVERKGVFWNLELEYKIIEASLQLVVELFLFSPIHI